ncbi:MAG: prepilin-type N-terminal cleavage/methylation domain-containing protein, partial [Cytophagales bacterium]|nr:prepilin-type N-terminal cleavage/methylation domain-containing protein [Armatimonadota bacterium]
MSKDKRGAFRAFTLIELLVVIAILATVLFPVFAQARQNYRTTAGSRAENTAVYFEAQIRSPRHATGAHRT